MPVRRPRRPLPLLLAAVLALATAPTACDGGPDEPAVAPTPTANATPEAVTPVAATASPTPAATATPTPTPKPTATPLPTPTPSPTPTATPAPTPTATPSPTPTATATPAPTSEAPGIREGDVAEALADAGVAHMRYAAGTTVLRQAGLYLLDVETGDVETWVCPDPFTCADFRLSPSNRFLAIGGWVYDRRTERLHDMAAAELGPEDQPRNLAAPGRLEAFVDFDGGRALTQRASGGACRLLRYNEAGTLLSDVSFPSCWLDLAPDGNLVSAWTFETAVSSSPYGVYQGMAISIFDAATGEEVRRISGAAPATTSLRWRDRVLWLPDSSGVIVGTSRGDRLATLDGQWERVEGLPAPDGSGVFAAETTVTDREGRALASLEFEWLDLEEEYETLASDVSWGASGDELRVHVYARSLRAHVPGVDWGVAPLDPVIEFPPFEDRLFVEVVVDTCLNLREEPTLEAAILACLPSGAVAEADDYNDWWWSRDEPGWLHLRTDDGLEGWASAEYLRWRSDGVRLEEAAPADTAAAEPETPRGPFATVAVGGHRDACALTEAGRAVCWDRDDAGAANVLPGRYIAIDADGGTTCAVTEDGEAACWGADASASDAPPGRYTTISTTDGYTCALTEDGEAVCWGSNSARALQQRAQEGDANSSAWHPQWMPDPPAGRYLAITVGTSHYFDGSLRAACAAKAGGGYVCWRSSTRYKPEEQGRIWHEGGDSTASLISGDFCAVNELGDPYCASGDPYTAISRGWHQVCAITTGGLAECWTSGHDAMATGTLRVMRPPDPSPARYVAISSDGDYGCAVTDAGDLHCWESEPNVAAPPDPAPGRYVSVSDGGHHTCALTEAGEVVCWGLNNFGQADAPTGRYTSLSSGELHSCALAETGEPVCWGLYGRLPEASYAAVIAGGRSSCALTEAGEGICQGLEWGYVDDDPPPGRYASLSVGEFRACALTGAGEAICWTSYGRVETETPPGPFTAIGVGGGRTCALTERGEAVCWDRDGALTMEAPPGRYGALAVGWNHACGLTQAGEAACWVWRYDRYKGLATKGPYEDELAQPPPGPFVAISASEHRSCAVTEAGEVVCWGDVGYTSEPRPLQVE